MYVLNGIAHLEIYTMKNCLHQNHITLQLELKKTHIQLLCNYPLGIIISMQLSLWKYRKLINRLPRHKIS